MKKYFNAVLLICLILSCKKDSGEDEFIFPNDFNYSPIEDAMNIGTFYYPWFGLRRHWEEGYKGKPVLGEYNSRDSLVIYQHLEWAINHGIDFFIMSWFGVDSYEDLTLRNHFTELNIPSCFRFGILYETPHLVKLTDGKINMSDQTVIAQIISDFRHLNEYFFNHPNYLKIEEKPVVYMYLTRLFTGDIQKGMEKIRSELFSLGIELYLIGDQVYWQDPKQADEKLLMEQFEAVSAYNMHASVGDIDRNFTEQIDPVFKDWEMVANAEEVDFIPSVLPGFDDRNVRPGANNPTIQRSAEKFEKQCRMALNYLSDKNLILITSWNEWHEYTQLEPDKEYQFLYLEVVKNQMANFR